MNRDRIEIKESGGGFRVRCFLQGKCIASVKAFSDDDIILSIDHFFGFNDAHTKDRKCPLCKLVARKKRKKGKSQCG